ncbi:unnamed protein product, partial [Symbiodinium pilosum]
EWTLVYHDGDLKGRAEPLKLLMEDAGVKYDVTSENLYGETGHMDAFRGSAEAVARLDNAPSPVMFPPVIWHRPPSGDEVYVNQTAACLSYLGRCLGYSPTVPAEIARADQITQNAVDYVAEGRASFHPMDQKAPYTTQKEEADKKSKEWSAGRMGVWLQHFEKVVKRVGAEKPIAGGSSITYADFMLFHALD